MSFKPLLAIGLIASAALLGCTSPGEPASAVEVSEVLCTCGTPEAALEGCAHPLCLSGQGNPASADCVCGALDFGRGPEPRKGS